MFDISRFHKLGVKDFGNTNLEIFSQSVATGLVADAAPAVNHTQIPLDKILLVTSWVLDIQPGANQSILFAILVQRQLNPLFDRYVHTLHQPYALAAGSQNILSSDRELLIYANTIPRALVAFNSGLNNNSFTSHIVGFLFPKGQLPGAP